MSQSRTRNALTRRLAALACGLVFAAAVLVAFPATASAEVSATISDASVAEAVAGLVDAGILLGRDGSAVVPQDYVTRGQLAIYLARALDLSDSTSCYFNDLVGPEACFGAVGALYEAGLIAGTSATTFSPDELVSRQQAAVWIVESLGKLVGRAPGSLVPFRLSYFEPAGAWLAGFRDRPLIDPACARAVANAYRLQIVDATAFGWFYPTLPLSRGDMAIMLHRAFVRPVLPRQLYPEALPTKAMYSAQQRGSEGPLVWYIEYQLAALQYRPGPIDGVYDNRTRDAVMAFQKIERMKRNGVAGDEFWQRITTAKTPAPKLTDVGTRVEVDLTRQVLMMITDNRVWKIVHVSTGAQGTRTGHFQIKEKYKGWVELVTLDGRIYYPSYVVSRTAIHGYPSVPAWPASHGCIRIPLWMAAELFYETPTGMTIDIYYNNK